MPRDTGPIPWLPLLRGFTHAAPSWLVWKNADDALLGRGDVDSVAVTAEWAALSREHRRWAAESGFACVLECKHLPGTLFLVALEDFDRGRLVEVDISDVRTFRGGQLFSAEQLQPLAESDKRGFRRLRPGAEALLILLTSAVHKGGRLDAGVARDRRLQALLRADPVGAKAAAVVLGPTGTHALKAAEALASGRWDRGAYVRAELAAVRAAARQPRRLATVLHFDFIWRRRCPVIAALLSGRATPRDPAAWLAEAARDHPVVHLRPSNTAANQRGGGAGRL